MTTRRSKVTGDAFQIVIMAKAPLSGAVKTRLCPPLTADQAAALAEAALFDTMDAVSASSARRRVLAIDGRLAGGVPLGFDVIAQRGGDFGTRLAGAVDDAWARDRLPVVVIGMDTPQLRGSDLDAAAEALLGYEPDQNRSSAVLGPAEDGGYWAIGTRRPVPGMFDGVPMSTSRTGSAQLSRLRALGVDTTVIGPQRDVDEFDDALAVAALAPATRFAATLGPMVDRRLPPAPAPVHDHDPVAMGQR